MNRKERIEVIRMLEKRRDELLTSGNCGMALISVVALEEVIGTLKGLPSPIRRMLERVLACLLTDKTARAETSHQENLREDG